jgi:hypothetical protein
LFLNGVLGEDAASRSRREEEAVAIATATRNDAEIGVADRREPRVLVNYAG